METFIIITYIVVGVLLALYWWNKHYKRDYDYAKARDEGVEDGMAVIFLMILALFWPLVAIYKGLKKIFK